MRKLYLISAISVLVLATLACGINFDLPVTTDIKTGPTTIKEIRIPNLDSTEELPELTLAFGAGELFLAPGAENALLEGTATYNVEDLKPEIQTDGNSVRISTGNLEINGIPNFQSRVKNIWEFDIGEDPLDLTIKAGAYSGELELGGLSLTKLHISDGAADVMVNFDEPNQTVMRTLRYETGASNIVMTNLANANFETMIFQGGAGNYELDFSGELQNDAEAIIETGLSNIVLTIPENSNVEITTEGGLSNISTRGEWLVSGRTYSMEGQGPKLTITVEVGAGNLTLRTP
ncbi:MAG: hypothetical protein ISR58_11390 [Anaerolineales bacterium]|nr:hypothetical protein [Chloroflexota bacterium]MBL6981779.1 hypothetical protein [Anaerolineales bacterium]